MLEKCAKGGEERRIKMHEWKEGIKKAIPDRDAKIKITLQTDNVKNEEYRRGKNEEKSKEKKGIKWRDKICCLTDVEIKGK